MTLAYWKALLERAIKTAAQSAIALIGSTALVTDVNWVVVGAGVAMATVLSVLSSLASIKLTRSPGPSLTSAEIAPESLPPAQG